VSTTSQGAAARAEMLAAARGSVTRLVAALTSLEGELDEGLVDVAELLLATEGHVVVSGSGTSSTIAARLAHLLTVVGVPAFFLSSGDGVHGGAATVTARDALIAISKGGESDELNVLVRVARGAGAPVIAITQSPAATLARSADHVLCHPSPDDLDPGGHIAVGSSVFAAVIGDALCWSIVAVRGVDTDRLREIHPGGAVGKALGGTFEA
jgi:D-arabinose 5-phosphate isomerase GutQ